MLRIDRILFPTDGWASADRARRHAGFLADRHGATLHVLHVDERDVQWTDVIDVTEADVLADLHVDLGASEMDVPPARVQQHTLVHASVPDGILAYASEHDVDLIVMGTHGRRGVRRFLMGSVAEEVVRRSNCPVFTVHTADSGDEPMQSGDGADDQAGATAERGIRRMLVPIDFSDQTKPLLDHAREIARAYQTDVDLVHVVEPVSLPSAYGNAPVALNADDLKSGALSALDEQCEAFRDALGETAEGTIEVRGHLRMGHPAEEVLSLAEELDTDLIAIATHGRTGVKRLLMGSVSEKIVRMAPVPVFTVKSHGRSLVQSPRAASTAAES